MVGVVYMVGNDYLDARGAAVSILCVYTNFRHRKILGVKKCYNVVSEGWHLFVLEFVDFVDG